MALPEVRKAIDGIAYVCDHLRKEDQEKMVFIFSLNVKKLINSMEMFGLLLYLRPTDIMLFNIEKILILLVRIV